MRVELTVNGEARAVPLTPDAMEVLPQKSIVLTDTGGIWEDEIETWSMQIAVTSDKDDVCRREVRLK